MKGIIIGHLGSIGKRRWQILSEDYPDIELVGADAKDKINVGKFVEQNKYVDFGIVCSPTHNHVEHCLMLAENGIPFFCEKPFCGKVLVENRFWPPLELSSLFETVRREKIPNMVACNWRFYDQLKRIPKKSKFVRAEFGYRLDRWNENDHLESYSASRKKGGGILLDAIHEFDYLSWIFGKILHINLKAYRLNNGSQTIDTEDLVFGNLIFQNGTVAEIHLNYLSEKYVRFCEYFEDDILKKINLLPMRSMYALEMKHFLENVVKRKKSYNDIIEANKLIEQLLTRTTWMF